jgi:3-oxoacyl-[acyl-carrier-protein] synthase-3
MHAALRSVEYHLPENTISTADLTQQFPEWSADKIASKTGIECRHVAGAGECASDLAVAAAGKVFSRGDYKPTDIDYVLFCTQTPDYFLPTTACLIQTRLGIPTSAGALDFNLGCSGYVYGLGLAEALISSGQATTVLLLTADTYTRLLHPDDRSTRTVFGDGASASILTATSREPSLGPFVYGSDGSGGSNLIVPTGGLRNPRNCRTTVAIEGANGEIRSEDCLFMNGPEIFSFALSVVPDSVERLLAKSKKALEDVDLFVFHQANKFMLDHLRKRLKIPPDRFYVFMKDCGNTVSSTIPIALKHASKDGLLPEGSLAMLVGYGVGYSWGAALLRATQTL